MSSNQIRIITGVASVALIYWLSDYSVTALLIIFLGAIVLGLFLLRPKIATAIGIVAILFSQSIEQISKVAAIGLTDEAVVIMAAVIFPVHRLLSGNNLRWLPGTGWFALFLLMGLLSGIANSVPLVLNLQGAFLLLKGIIFALALAQLDWSSADIKKAATIGGLVLGFVLLMAVVNLAVPGPWTQALGRMRGGVQYRLGLPSLIGPFVHPVAFGQVLALGSCAVLAFRLTVGKGPWSMFLLCGSLVGGLLSLRRKVLVALGASMLAVRLALPNKRLSTGMVALVVTPLVLLISFDAIASVVAFTYDEYVVNGSVQARTIFYRDSVIIGVQGFPFGAGFSRFGSYLASTHYSPEYVERGYQWIWGLGPGDTGGFLVDTFWPAILGETGIVGLIAYVLGLTAMFRMSARIAGNESDPYIKWAAIVLVAWSVEFAIESIAAPVYNSPPTFVLLFGLAGIVASFRKVTSQTTSYLDRSRMGLLGRCSPSGG